MDGFLGTWPSERDRRETENRSGEEERERINWATSISAVIVVATFDFTEKKDAGRAKVGGTFNEVRCPQKEKVGWMESAFVGVE